MWRPFYSTFQWIFSDHTEWSQNTIQPDDIQYTVHHCSCINHLRQRTNVPVAWRVNVQICVFILYSSQPLDLPNTNTSHPHLRHVSIYTWNTVTHNLNPNVQFCSSAFSITLTVCVCQCTCHEKKYIRIKQSNIYCYCSIYKGTLLAIWCTFCLIIHMWLNTNIS